MTNQFKHCPIKDMGFDHRVGQYLLSLKIGKYQEFNSFSYSNQRHYHDCYELVLVLDGFGSFEHNGLTHTLKAGDLFISNPFAEHEIHVTPSESMTVFYMFLKITSDSALINNTFEEQLISAFIKEHTPFVHKNRELFAYLNFVEAYIKANGSKPSPWISRNVFDFLFNCLEKLSMSKPKDIRYFGIYNVNTFERILDYINQNMEMKITATTISETINLSKRTIYTLFRENLDCTVHAYIKERKMALAKHYLLMNLPVTEVAGLVGFDNLPQFSRTFKEFVGLSPRAFIKKQSVNPSGIGRRLT